MRITAVTTCTCLRFQYVTIAMNDSGGRMVSSTVPAAVLKLETMPSTSNPGTMISAPDCPSAPPAKPATMPRPRVGNAVFMKDVVV